MPMKKRTFTFVLIAIGLLILGASIVNDDSTTAEQQLPKLAIAQTSVAITIKDNGSIEGTNQIQRSENIYTMTGNISGNIQIRKSNIILDGAGFTLQGNNGTGIAISNDPTEQPHPSEFDIWNVTVKNLRITNFHIGIKCDNGGSHTFYGNYISNDVVTQNGTGVFSWESLGIALWGSSGNNITHCTIGGSPAIYMHFAVSNNFVSENNIVFGAHLAISGIETFDRNYWSDYSIKYPNASEGDSSGVWNIPYVFSDSTNFENRKFQDTQPLMSPLTIPNFSNTLPTVKSIQESVIFSVLIIVSTIVAVVGMGLFVFFKKHR